MKRKLTITMASLLLLCMAGCDKPVGERYDIVVFGTGAEMSERTKETYLGVTDYANEHGMTVQYRYPSDLEWDTLQREIREASNVQPKYFFFADPVYAKAIFEQQTYYLSLGRIHFACLGFYPQALDGVSSYIASNCLVIDYDKAQIGYIAGAVASQEYDSFGFVRTETSSEYEQGFSQGIGEKSVRYGTADDVALWYEEGVEVVFAPEDTVDEVAPIASAKGMKVIGTEFDRSEYGDCVLFSCIYDYRASAYATLALGEGGLNCWTVVSGWTGGYNGKGMTAKLGIKTGYYWYQTQDYVYYNVPERLQSAYELVRDTVEEKRLIEGKS